ncbi:2768_t:CDS:2 [Dentiscutata erythropus]|uniref:2768_t:CDS:1 n=1 Tax=Dentiscutata erythropus TaxID=1348616 RepID=A0A9N9IEP8_9GLOM|nr:2768_t:CDS:2 [Dentiscutata erythropus]
MPTRISSVYHHDYHFINYYISLGDSYAAGVEITGPSPEKYTTSAYSYVDALYDLLKAKYKNLELIKLGISGKTSDGLINDELTNFMKSHYGLTKFITITIGTNDMHICKNDASECFNKALNNLTNNLKNIIIPQLKEAGGENVHYMASTYYLNPLLDDRLIDIYSKNGFKVVDLRTIITDYTRCSYTYTCTHNNSHPNEDGSYAIGKAFYEII